MSKKLTQNEVIERFRQVHGDKYDYSKVVYVGMNEKVIIICPEHGEFLQTPAKHINRKQGCPKCKFTKLSKLFSSNTEEFVQKASLVHSNRYTYDRTEYVQSRQKVIVTCPKHGDFLVTPDNHLRGKGCPRCKTSIGENAIEDWLKGSKLSYKRQFTIKSDEIDRPSHKLVVDFLVEIEDRKYLIEYDGIQHFRFTEAFHKTQEGFEAQQRRDNMLNTYCQNHSDEFTLIRVNYLQSVSEITHILCEKLI